MKRDPSDLAAAAAQELENRFAAHETRIKRLEWFVAVLVLLVLIFSVR